MKTWRPKGWEEIKKRKQMGNRLQNEAFDPYDLDPNDFYEAGADVMLKALIGELCRKDVAEMVAFITVLRTDIEMMELNDR